MTKGSNGPAAGSSPNSGTGAADDSVDVDDLNRLRQLLVGPERADLDRIQRRLDQPLLDEEEVGRVLPDAIIARDSRDDRLTTALTPTVENILSASVRRDPRPIVNALFPVIGPAIRKSISETFRQMVQSLNRTLEYSFSLQGLKWRLTAWRSGRPFAEVVLLNSLIYRVEQVFCIHRDTGLLLGHVVAAEIDDQDGDLISAMLTAINDFVADSFRPQSGGQGLQTVRVGDLTVLVEQGPAAILAGVVRGSPAENLRPVFQTALEDIHAEFLSELTVFDGDNQPFEAAQPYLQSCLASQYKPEKGRISPLLWILPLLLIALIGTWAVFSYRQHHRWQAYLQALDDQPGLVITSVERRAGKRVISGLKDPLAEDPTGLLATAGIDATKVETRWSPYAALEPQFVIARARRLIDPPTTVTLRWQDGVLFAAGKASAQWVATQRQTALALAGVERFDASGIQVIETDAAALERIRNILKPPSTVSLAFRRGQLTLTGNAPHNWVASTRTTAATIAGVTEVKSDALIDSDQETWRQLIEEVRGQRVLFTKGGDTLTKPALTTLSELSNKLKHLHSLSVLLQQPIEIRVIGHTDESGSDQLNERLRKARAETVRKALATRGVAADMLVAQPPGPAQTVDQNAPVAPNARAFGRYVTFDIRIKDRHG